METIEFGQNMKNTSLSSDLSTWNSTASTFIISGKQLIIQLTPDDVIFTCFERASSGSLNSSTRLFL
jgi:hypothetical protein